MKSEICLGHNESVLHLPLNQCFVDVKLLGLTATVYLRDPLLLREVPGYGFLQNAQKSTSSSPIRPFGDD